MAIITCQFALLSELVADALVNAESLDEDWEKDFDVEVTEQELEAAKERLKNASTASPVAADTGKVCTVYVMPSCHTRVKTRVKMID